MALQRCAHDEVHDAFLRKSWLHQVSHHPGVTYATNGELLSVFELMNQGIRVSKEKLASAKVPQSVTVREASFADYGAIRLLASRYGLETKSYEEWRHLWLGNLLYDELQRKWPIGWVLEGNGQHIVGYIGNIPRWYELQEQKITAAVTYSWVVDSSYRSYSILLLDRYFDQKNVDLYLSTTVNAQAFNAFTAFNSLPVPVGAWDRSAFWITHYRGFASSWATFKGLPFGRPLSYVLSVPLLFKDLSARRDLDVVQNGVDVKCCNSFDDRFDIFWSTLKRQNSAMLLAVRSREVLQWHFKYAILQNRIWILTITKGSELVSYSIFYRQDNPKIGLKRIRLIDFQVLDGNMALLLAMLSQALKRCRQEGIHMLEYVGFCPEVERLIESLDPQQRKLPSWLYYYKSKGLSLARTLVNPKVWNPTCFDGDSSL